MSKKGKPKRREFGKMKISEKELEKVPHKSAF